MVLTLYSPGIVDSCGGIVDLCGFREHSGSRLAIVYILYDSIEFNRGGAGIGKSMH